MKALFFQPLEDYGKLEVSTQDLIRVALGRGMNVRVVEERSNFVLFSNGEKEVPVIEATICQKTGLWSHWVNENKALSKILLKERALHTPCFREWSSEEVDEALQRGTWRKLLSKSNLSYPIVVKPSDTNYGLGVMANIQEDAFFKVALQEAIRYSKRIIIEQFVTGREYRFFVIDGKCHAVCYRQPANVIGDGEKTIGALIEEKNVGRGTDYTYPLLKIKVDEEIRQQLQDKKLNLETILPKGEQCFLREKSNVSNGGESIDITDDMPSFFKEKAEEACCATRSPIGGVDIIIDDIHATDPEKAYQIIEINERPALMIHTHPFLGKARDLANPLLDLIFS